LELVRGVYEALAQNDAEGPFEVYSPEIEWDLSRWPEGGLRPVYRGHAGVRRFWHDWLGAWEEADASLEGLMDAGSDVVALVDFRGIARSPRQQLERASLAQVWTVADELVVRMCVYADRDEACAAVGLRS
jgi:ketosteroid isomerase-like protein